MCQIKKQCNEILEDALHIIFLIIILNHFNPQKMTDERIHLVRHRKQ